MPDFYIVTPSTPGTGLCLPALGDTLTVVNQGTEAIDVSIGSVTDSVFLASVPAGSQYVRTSVEAVSPAPT